MSDVINEVSQTLREFFPNPDLRHQLRYEFAYRFVPEYVHQNPYAFFSYLYRNDLPGLPMEPTRFIHTRWSFIFERHYGVTAPQPPSILGRMANLIGLTKRGGGDPQMPTVFRRVTDLSMSIGELGGRPCTLIEMPKPENQTDAHFICVVLLARVSDVNVWPSDVAARVFVLEHFCFSEKEDAPDAGAGLVSEMTREGDRRPHYSLMVPVNRDAFLQAVATLLDGPDANAPMVASFAPATE